MNIESIITLSISVLALIVSGFSAYYSYKASKPKFTDSPHNAYTVKLDSIKSSLDGIRDSIQRK